MKCTICESNPIRPKRKTCHLSECIDKYTQVTEKKYCDLLDFSNEESDQVAHLEMRVKELSHKLQGSQGVVDNQFKTISEQTLEIDDLKCKVEALEWEVDSLEIRLASALRDTERLNNTVRDQEIIIDEDSKWITGLLILAAFETTIISGLLFYVFFLS